MNELVEGGKGALELIGKGVDATVDFAKKLNPLQKGIDIKIPFMDRPLVKPFEPTAYSKTAKAGVDDVTTANKSAEIARNNANARLTANKNELDQIQAAKQDTSLSKSARTNILDRERELRRDIRNDTKTVASNQPQALPKKDEYSALRYAIPTFGANALVKHYTSSDEKPGWSPLEKAGDFTTDLGKWAYQGVKDFGKGAIGDDGKMSANEKPRFGEVPSPDAPNADKDKDGIDESLYDILKLSGQRAITTRDNVAGIVKPKEIVALHESTQLDECGIMPSAPNQTASLSINATAGNGQEVANMLAAIMNLAGVKPVSSDMLGTSAMPPMPIVKAIDIISRGDSDSMNGGHHDHDDKETLTGSMEEEYGNTPENPTDVPDLDTNAHAHQPNAVDVGDRMDGTMPKGFPQVTQESLLQAYNQFKNGQ